MTSADQDAATRLPPPLVSCIALFGAALPTLWLLQRDSHGEPLAYAEGCRSAVSREEGTSGRNVHRPGCCVGGWTDLGSENLEFDDVRARSVGSLYFDPV